RASPDACRRRLPVHLRRPALCSSLLLARKCMARTVERAAGTERKPNATETTASKPLETNEYRKISFRAEGASFSDMRTCRLDLLKSENTSPTLFQDDEAGCYCDRVAPEAGFAELRIAIAPSPSGAWPPAARGFLPPPPPV